MPSSPLGWVVFAGSAAAAVAGISWTFSLTIWPGVVVSLLVSVWQAAKQSA